MVADAFPTARGCVPYLQQLLLLQLPANSFIKDENCWSKMTFVMKCRPLFFFLFKRKAFHYYLFILGFVLVFQYSFFNLERAFQRLLIEILQVRALGQLPQRALKILLVQVPGSRLRLALVEDDIVEEYRQGVVRSVLI